MTNNKKEYAGVPRYNPILKEKCHVLRYSVIDNPPLPIYSDLIPAFCRALKRNIKNHHQNCIPVIGMTGSGKSTLAIQLCKEMDYYFSLQADYIYSAIDLADKLDQPEGSVSKVSLFDEATVTLNSFNSARRGDRDIVVLFDTMRSKGWTTFLCIPELRSLNNRVREDHANYLVVCCDKSPLPGYSKRGFFKLFIRSRASQFTNKIFWKPVCYGIYKPLPAKLDKEYQEIKSKHQDLLLDRYKKRVREEE